ncbi:ODF2L protein, partial [Panurus biarmicus]|nr:ODF2L protein [Panurus biarmicus]
VQKRQIAVEELKSRYETVLKENKRITEKKRLKADKVSFAVIKSHLSEITIKLLMDFNRQAYFNPVRSCIQVSPTRNKLSFSQDNRGVTSLGNLSLEEEICNIQKIYEDLLRQLGEVEYQNEELAYQLRKEDECLQSRKLQLEEKIAEYNALTRQLKSALEEGRRMVAEEQEKMSYKEQAFQTKLLLLEAEVRKRQEEKKQLLCLFHHNEKHHEVHLKELENNLQKSENKNQSIQNYVQFLKDAYVTMFG